MLRYSDYDFSKIGTSPIYRDINISTSKRNSFTYILSNHLSKLALDTGINSEKYMTKSYKLNEIQNLYILQQCTQDLAKKDCVSCLNHIISTAIPWSKLGSVGGRVLYPSCNLRFELFKFYGDDYGANKSTFTSSPRDAGELFVKITSLFN